ncbi:IstB-like ATP binding protein [Puniceibacterium sp. IMCC21224]|nr:IstB-like ATP binding protein [Puniceibacterium sp. IMCC21224]
MDSDGALRGFTHLPTRSGSLVGETGTALPEAALFAHLAGLSEKDYRRPPCLDELGFVPLSKTGAELLFELISQRYERGATLITSNLPFDEWTETFGSERLTGALLDRLTHHVNILEMNGDSYRLGQSKARQGKA